VLQRERAVDAPQHFFFSEDFQQVIETRSHVAPGQSETGGMDDRADFGVQLYRCVFNVISIVPERGGDCRLRLSTPA
jgi:hypothetical protein